MIKFDNVGGRKFAFSVLVLLINLGLILFHYLGEQNWVTIVLGLTAVYVGGNVAHHYTVKNQPANLDKSGENNAESK